jgi:DNA-binding NarL/FixJ family response regulator
MHDGLTTPDIARRLCVSESTVKTHISGIYRKLDAHNRMGANREAERRGILSTD